jgi:hypothetical protein
MPQMLGIADLIKALEKRSKISPGASYPLQDVYHKCMQNR